MAVGRASPQAGAGLRAGARRGRRRPAARIAAAVYVSPELYSLPVSQEFASLRPPLGGRTRLVVLKNLSVCCNIVLFSAFCGTTCSWGTAVSARAKRVKCNLAIIHHIIGNNNAWISGHFCVLVFSKFLHLHGLFTWTCSYMLNGSSL